MKKDTEKLLELKGASVSYGGVHALSGASVYVDEGEVVALMGPNGAGKSTALKAMFGMAPISEGSVLWEGAHIHPVSHEMVSRGAAFVPQGRRVFSDLTVEENLEVGAVTVKDRNVIRERIRSLYDMFPALREKRNEKSGSLSGGQQQMLAIARGLMCDPKVLLLDEPSLGLSPKIVKEVFAFIKEINEKRKTAIVVVEHNLKSLLTIATRGYVLNRGAVVAEGAPEKLIRDGVLEKVFSGRDA